MVYWGERSESLPIVMSVEILSVCLCVLSVCHGPARYSFFVLVTLNYQPLRESMRMGKMKLRQDTGHRHGWLQ